MGGKTVRVRESITSSGVACDFFYPSALGSTSYHASLLMTHTNAAPTPGQVCYQINTESAASTHAREEQEAEEVRAVRGLVVEGRVKPVVLVVTAPVATTTTTTTPEEGVTTEEVTTLQKYVRMVALHVPVGTIGHEMAQDGFLDERRVLVMLGKRVPPAPGRPDHQIPHGGGGAQRGGPRGDQALHHDEEV